MRTPTTLACLAALALGCGTKFVGDVPQDGSSGGDESSAGDGHSGVQPGDDGLSGNVADEGGSSESGDAEACLPIEEECLPAGEILRTAIFFERTPAVGYDQTGMVSDACTIASAGFDVAFDEMTFVLDCDNAVAWKIGLTLPDEAYAQLWVGRELEVVYAWEDGDHQQNLALLAGAGDPIVHAQNGRSVTPTQVDYDPFSVEIVGGDCLPYCVPEDQCYSSQLMKLRFGLGDDTVDLWNGIIGELGDERTYTVRVDFAVENPDVNPGVFSCQSVALPQYWFVIAETTPI